MNAAENLKLNDSELMQGKVELQSLPVVVNLATTSRCNVQPPCVMCLRNKDDNPQDIPWKTLLRAAYLADTASTMILHGVGEPLVYEHLFDLAAIGDGSGLKMFTTNGMLLGSYLEPTCSHITKLSISIDAASVQMYERIRHNDLRRVTDAISDLVAMKLERGQSTPQIDISMCLMNANVVEATDFVEMGHDLGVDTVHFYHMNQGPEYDWRVGWFDYPEQHCHLNVKRHDRQITRALKRAKELGVPVIFDGTSLFKKEYEFEFAGNPSAPPIPEHGLMCDEPWRRIQVNADSTVMNCCYQTWAIGSLEDSSVADLWNGDCQRAVRQGIISGNLHEYCQKANCPPKGRI